MTHILNLQAIVPGERDAGGDDGPHFDPVAFGSNFSLVLCSPSVSSWVACLARD